MSLFENPALNAFVAKMGDELLVAQVLIRREGEGYQLRHVDDRDFAMESLKRIPLNEARTLAQFTAAGAFRPLKSAPNLRRGWRMVLSDDAELEGALSRLYPGAVADWFATRAAKPPVTNFREFVNRQSGMYRITAKLTDEQAAQVIKKVCATESCLKRRLWSVAGLEPDRAGQKSIIPCLEPCAILLESARQAMRAEQREKERAPGLADDTDAY
jgi:hypothetical protein